MGSSIAVRYSGAGIMLAGAGCNRRRHVPEQARAAEPMVDGPWTNEVGAVIPPLPDRIAFLRNMSCDR